ncbi:hypothetical protein EDB84DRAFT_1570618 [Lactarius hengduanensis]|nr:hypothetical protein EDB84DRAFT_1570618 [Lactarius hengduanensis]
MPDLSPRRISLSDTLCILNAGAKKHSNVPIDVGQELASRLSLTAGTRALLPSENLPVSELLELCLPTLSGVMPSMDPELCFSSHPPTDSVAIYLSRPVPPVTFIKGLRNAAGQATLNGKLSIMDWTCKNSTSFFSFELIEFWAMLTKAINARREWAAAMKWLEQAGEDKHLDKDVREVRLILQTTPWSGNIKILRSRLMFLEMATFLSDGWLSSSQIDMALSSIVHRQHKSSNSQVLSRYLIGSTLLDEYLGASPVLHNKSLSQDNLPWQDYKLHAPQDLQYAGNHLVRYQPDGEVLFIAYSPPGHWAAISVTSRGSLEWADSLGHSPPMGLVIGVRNWLNYHLSESSSSFGLGNSFKCSHQTDSFSCGTIALNAIKHRVFGDILWREEDHAWLRIREFLDIMRVCQKIEGKTEYVSSPLDTVECSPFGVSDSNIPLLSTGTDTLSLPHLHRLNQCDTLDVLELSSDTGSDLASSTTWLTDLDEQCPSSPDVQLNHSHLPHPGTSSPTTATTLRKGGLHSYFPTVHLGKRSCDAEDQTLPCPPKRIRIQPTPTLQSSLSSTSKETQKPLKKPGKSAVNKLTLNQAVKAGTFKHNKIKWETFKSKILDIDPRSEVDDDDPKRARKVLHIKCGKPITMAMVYDVSVYKSHVDKCTGESNTASAGMRTLDRGLSFICKLLTGPTLQMFVFLQKAGSSVSVGSGPCDDTSSLWPCPGLSGDIDPQIDNYLLRSTVPSAGGITIEKVADNMYKKAYKDLTEAEKQAVRIGQMHTHRWTLEHQRRRIFATGTKPCLREVLYNAGSPQPCDACRALLKDRAFRTAISRNVPDDENRKFTPHLYQAAEIAKISAKHSGLSAIFDKNAPHNELLLRFARKVATGGFDDKPEFMTFTSAIVTMTERQERGRGLQGMHYPPAFDEWCHELLCLSPGAYRAFRSRFGGRTERSFHQIRSKIPIFYQGISPDVYERARRYCTDYNYPLDAPLAIGVDDTALLRAIWPFLDPITQKWFAMGLVGDALKVSESYTSVEEFREHIESTGRSKADKLRLWTLQIPLPHVPPAVIAVAAISSRTTSSMLAQMDEDLIRVLMQREEPLCIISIGSDGAVSERKARQELTDNLIRSGEGEIAEHCITHPDGRSPPIAIPLLKVFGKAMVIVQDSKHCRKTMRNNLFSGARAIVLARYATFYQQVRDIADDTARSPLCRRDVERLDRQDDRAAERLFSSATLNYSINHLGKSSLGLSIYLFIFGDLIDAYQSRKVSHAERVVMVLRAKFFKDLWKSFLHKGRYSAQHYFISNDADKIVDTLILGLLGLIFIHRDFLDTSFPLMPWAHGSESNEHVFGIMRSLITDFTMLDVVRMIPKLTVRLQAACCSRHQNFGETAAGYSHTYFHDEDTPLSLFSQYPSDENLNSLAGVAYDEACYLWSLLGYESSDVLSPSRSQPGGPIPDDPDDVGEDSEDGATIPDRRELLDAIEAIATPTHDGMSREDSSHLHEYTFEAAAFNLQDFSDIDLLQADSDPVILRDLANQVQGILKASESLDNPALVTPSNSDISQSTRMPLTSSDDISFLVEIRRCSGMTPRYARLKWR